MSAQLAPAAPVLSVQGPRTRLTLPLLAPLEPSVLSARRISYQCMDAMLPTFTPINHLKLLERRLELWAKVFEASSEGILIVDAQQHILTANRAFSDHTG